MNQVQIKCREREREREREKVGVNKKMPDKRKGLKIHEKQGLSYTLLRVKTLVRWKRKATTLRVE